jgi:TonB family protein
MKRSKLRNFFFTSILFHVGLVAVIALLAVYFFEKEEKPDVGAIVVGVVNGDGPAREGEVPEEPATSNKASASTATGDTHKVEKIEPVRPVIRKEAPSIKTDTQIADKQPERESLINAKNDTKTKNSVEANTKSITNKATGETRGTETAKADTGTKDSGTSLNSASTEKAFSSAYPDYGVNPKPVYPTAARRRGYEGDVKLRVLVLENGKVGEIEIEKPSGYEVLDESALNTVNDWVFIPGKENGKEVSSWVTVPISFRLKSG